jgi:hypothetical protein
MVFGAKKIKLTSGDFIDIFFLYEQCIYYNTNGIEEFKTWF